MIHAGGDANAVLIGHDWGAEAAYLAAAHAPERWRRLVTLAEHVVAWVSGR
jgi:pimeloyl-ACP methyl ester carboxylesterase